MVVVGDTASHIWDHSINGGVQVSNVSNIKGDGITHKNRQTVDKATREPLYLAGIPSIIIYLLFKG
jgi:hypothetical protein